MKIYCVSPYVPTSGMLHAGGTYLFRHVSALAKKHEVIVVAPATAENTAANAGARHDWQVELVGTADPGVLESAVDKFSRAVMPFQPGVVGLLRMVRQLRLLTASAQGDVVEVQWPQMQGLVLFRGLISSPRWVSVPHDILAQRIGRQRASKLRTRRVQGWLIVGFVSKVEAMLMRSYEKVLVFSEKDRDLLRGDDRVLVIPPPFPVNATRRNPAPSRDRLLFTAAFDRPVNDAGAKWFLDHVWPLVIERHPRATLMLAGANPSPSLEKAAGLAPGVVTVTGALPDLSAAYGWADVFVAPILEGAGVKFKCLEAMLAEIPVVATHCAAEGINPSWFEAVTDSAIDFAEACCGALRDRSAGDDASREVGKAVALAHSLEAFSARLAGIYPV